MPAMSSTSIANPLSIGTTDAARRERQGQWLMVGGGVLLGTLGIFIQEAQQDPLTAVWFRCVFGGAALLVWGALTGRLAQLRLTRAGLAAALGAGLLVMLNWALFFGAIERTSIAVATVVFHVQPLWVIAFGAWWLRERVTRQQCGAALVALAGLALATGLFEPGTSGAAQPAWSERYIWGLVMCLGGSVSYAVVILIAKSARSVSSFALAWWQCAVGATLLCWWPWAHGWPQAFGAWAWLAGLGVIHTGLAYVVLYAGMARLPAGRIAVLQFVYPAAAVLVDWLVYGRALTPVQAAGVALMGVALWAARQRSE